MHELRNQHVSIDLVPQYGVNNDCVLCTVKTKKANNNTQLKELCRDSQPFPSITTMFKLQAKKKPN